MNMGAKVLGVLGGAPDVHGKERRGWTRLAANAARGSGRIALQNASGWRATGSSSPPRTTTPTRPRRGPSRASRGTPSRSTGRWSTPTGVGADHRRQARGRAGRGRAAQQERRHRGRGGHQRRRLRRPGDGHGGRGGPNRGRRAHQDGPERPAPLPAPLPHARRGRGLLLPAQDQLPRDLQPPPHRPRHGPAADLGQRLPRPPRPRLLFRGRRRDRQLGNRQPRPHHPPARRGRAPAAERRLSRDVLDHEPRQHHKEQRGRRLRGQGLLAGLPRAPDGGPRRTRTSGRAVPR